LCDAWVLGKKHYTTEWCDVYYVVVAVGYPEMSTDSMSKFLPCV